MHTYIYIYIYTCTYAIVLIHLAICSDVRSILKLHGHGLESTWVQVGIMLGCLESSWHAKRQTLNPKRKTSNSQLCTLLDFAHKTRFLLYGFETSECIGHRKHMHCRNAKIALALRLCSEIAQGPL